MANIKQTVKLGVFTLAIMNVTAVVSLRGLLCNFLVELFFFLIAPFDQARYIHCKDREHHHAQRSQQYGQYPSGGSDCYDIGTHRRHVHKCPP